jgi:hypothetical protein
VAWVVVLPRKMLLRTGRSTLELSLSMDTAGTQASQRRQQLVVRQDRHRSERVIEARSAITADLVAAPFEEEHAA